MYFDFWVWDFVFSLRFLVTFALVIAAFVPVIYHIRRTYSVGTEEAELDRTHD
jgi:hypothetical protein